jgi:hypothetical protein
MPSSFNIGPLTIHFYGIVIMFGAVAATYLARHEANRRGQNGDLVWDMLAWMLIAGIIGAPAPPLAYPLPGSGKGILFYSGYFIPSPPSPKMP